MTPASTQTGDIPATQATLGAGAWAVDPAHSEVAFTVRHLLSKVRGHFAEFSGTLTVTDPPGGSVVEGAVKTASVSTSQAQRDEHLRTSDFFDAATYPELTFRSTAIEPAGEASAKVTGDLTIKGVTKPVTWDVEFHGIATDPYGQSKAAFTGVATIDREEWGLNWNAALETGGVLVGREVKLEAELQFIQQKP